MRVGEGETALIAYMETGEGVLTLTHTEVSEGVRGAWDR